MKRTGPPCSICIHPRLAEIDAERGPVERVAKRFGVSKSALDRHRKHASKPVEKQEATTLPPPPPTTEREALLDGMARLKASLAKAELDDLPRITTAITSLGKRLEVIEAGREISESEIVKAPAFRSLLERFVEALRPYPEAARAMLAALEAA